MVVTHWDRVEAVDEARGVIADLESDLAVPVMPVDARALDRVAADGGVRTETDGAAVDYSALAADGRDVLAAIRHSSTSSAGGKLPGETGVQTGWQIEPPARIFERPVLGPVVSALVLLAPAAVAVWFANTVAGELDPIVGSALEPAIDWTETLPGPLAAVLGGGYGLLSMGPFLFVWALPTMLIFALFIRAYSASGLTMRVTTALHPVMRRVGLTGRDLVRVVMGFGCNVPVITVAREVSTRFVATMLARQAVAAIGFALVIAWGGRLLF
ncbi:nucleoside recognition domain-containing protein [Natronorubrum tibetense]|uniref:nucleoside recognition domain-containing protein n=1 Tax=Natronorubrum tibetense TaxID=63128 RepID=UPI001F4CB47E|nr:nucleoside recognition domain-containing protein [Natronorubrum tibetense]